MLLVLTLLTGWLSAVLASSSQVTVCPASLTPALVIPVSGGCLRRLLRRLLRRDADGGMLLLQVRGAKVAVVMRRVL
jgi:hypothetical protein